MFTERKNYNSVFMPGYEKCGNQYNPAPAGLKYIDHMVGNVDWNQMDTWVKWFEEVMGFENFLSFDDKQVSTEYSALMSKVMANGNGRIKFPINEPAEAKRNHRLKNTLNFTRGRAFSILL
jgi:4-hydroxyphenylpyruvate dioxygenase